MEVLRLQYLSQKKDPGTMWMVMHHVILQGGLSVTTQIGFNVVYCFGSWPLVISILYALLYKNCLTFWRINLPMLAIPSRRYFDTTTALNAYQATSDVNLSSSASDVVRWNSSPFPAWQAEMFMIQNNRHSCH